MNAERKDANYWGVPGREPSIAEMLADPLVHAVMRRDGIGACQVMAAVHEARTHLRRPAEAPRRAA